MLSWPNGWWKGVSSRDEASQEKESEVAGGGGVAGSHDEKVKLKTSAAREDGMLGKRLSVV